MTVMCNNSDKVHTGQRDEANEFEDAVSYYSKSRRGMCRPKKTNFIGKQMSSRDTFGSNVSWLLGASGQSSRSIISNASSERSGYIEHVARMSSDSGNFAPQLTKSKSSSWRSQHRRSKSESHLQHERLKPQNLWLLIRKIVRKGICHRITEDSTVDNRSSGISDVHDAVSKSKMNENNSESDQLLTRTSQPKIADNLLNDFNSVSITSTEATAQLTQESFSSLSSCNMTNYKPPTREPSERRAAIGMTFCPILMSGDADFLPETIENVSKARRSTVVEDMLTKSFNAMVKFELRRDWLSSFRRLDPRYQILKFFNDVAREGAHNIEKAGCTIHEEAMISPLLRIFSRASAFSVWRPTSNDAIRKMMTTEATGKGLDVKGKSAKKGNLSGFVPFLQIYEEEHKKVVRWPPKEGMIRIYYKSAAARNNAAQELTSVSNEMEVTVHDANIILNKSGSDEAENEVALENLILDVVDSKIHLLDDYSPSRFGIIVAERVFFRTYISMRNIARSPEYETGRSSEPAFQDMNFVSTRNYKGHGPRAVVLQLSDKVDEAICPQSLVIAYEEDERVTPVASDFDCFLVGTRGVTYETPLSVEQVKLVKWLLSQIEAILDSPHTSKSWTSRWLDVLKESAAKGIYHKVPEFGFGDPKSYAIMEDVVGRLKDNGAVRHGAECFNYSFPQELDDNFLVVSDNLEGNVPWKYVGVKELQDILCGRIEQGFSFPLNPKWILADHGWKALYDKMMSSKNESVQKALAVWYPQESGIRELIEDIYKRFPEGFQKLSVGNDEDSKLSGTEAMDLADQQLRRYLILKRAKFKLRCIICLMKLSKQHSSLIKN